MPVAERLAGGFAGLVVARPRLVLALFLAGTVALAWQARHFELDANADTLLTPNNALYLQTRVVDSRFGTPEFLLIAYQPRGHALLSAETFRDLRALKQALEQLERIESVRTILDVPLLPPGIEMGAKLDVADWTIARREFGAAELRRAFAGHPIYEDLLINKDQTATALQVLFRGDAALAALDARILALQQKSLEGALSEAEQAALRRLEAEKAPLEQRLDEQRAREFEAIRDILEPYRARAEIYLGGAHALGHRLIDIVTRDLVVFGAAIALLICGLLYLLFRRLRWVLIPVVCCACSVVATLGMFGLLGLKATVISSSFIALQLILTLALAIHLVVQYRELAAKHADWSQEQLVRNTLARKAGPVFYAGLTNIVGFGSLLLSELQPVIDFGWMMSLALLFSIGVSLILFPALMALFGREPAHTGRGPTRAVLDFFTRLSQRRPAVIALASLALAAAAALGIPRLDVENSFINYFREATRVHQELRFIDQQFGGTTPLDITYDVPPDERHRDLVMTAATIQQLQRIHAGLERHPAVGKVLSVVNFTEVARTINEGRPLTEYELTALYWTLEPALRADLLGAFFAPEHAQLRISVRIQDTTPGLRRGDLLAGIRADIEALGIAPDQYRLTSLFVIYQQILQQLFESQILTLGFSFGMLALMFVVIFRSVRIALIGMLPNLIATLAVLGLMGWLGITLDLMTIMIAAIALGITVDDTIHYLHRYLQELRGAAPAQAVARTHASVAQALLYTSMIVVLGFALLAFSDFVPSVLFGLLTALAMALAVLLDLTLLPVLLMRFVRKAR